MDERIFTFHNTFRYQMIKRNSRKDILYLYRIKTNKKKILFSILNKRETPKSKEKKPISIEKNGETMINYFFDLL